jgi:hypothetical protein
LDPRPAIFGQAEQYIGRFIGDIARFDAVTGVAQDRREEIVAPAVMVVGKAAQRLA